MPLEDCDRQRLHLDAGLLESDAQITSLRQDDERAIALGVEARRDDEQLPVGTVAAGGTVKEKDCP